MMYKSQFRKIDRYDWFCGPKNVSVQGQVKLNLKFQCLFKFQINLKSYIFAFL